MEQIPSFLEPILQDASKLFSSSKDLWRLKSVKLSATLGSMLLFHFLLFILGLFFVLFLSIVLTLFLGSVLNNYLWASLIVAGLFALIAGVFLLMKAKFYAHISKLIIKTLLTNS